MAAMRGSCSSSHGVAAGSLSRRNRERPDPTVRALKWRRARPGLFVGRLGQGPHQDYSSASHQLLAIDRPRAYVFRMHPSPLADATSIGEVKYRSSRSMNTPAMDRGVS